MDDSEPAAATAGYSALVRGPSPSFPRGGVWMFCVWYAVIYLCLLWQGGLTFWFNILALAVFGAAAAYTIMLFTKAITRAFAADGGGISSYPHGSILQIVLDSGAPVRSDP